jgi:hypothetical protein
MSRYLPDFAGVFCLAIFLISITTIGDGLLRDGDSFWHIKVGTVMLEQQRLIDSDIFSHTAFGTPWTAHEWLSEIIMAGVYKLAGLEGVLCFFLLITSLSFWLLFKITEKYANQWVSFGCVSLALAFSPSHMAARPHLFTWLFMVITLAILMNGGKRLYWLPVIMVVWTNLHGGFILGLVIQGMFLLGAVMEDRLANKLSFKIILQKQKPVSLVLLASILAVGINPFGYELLLFPFQVSSGVFSTLIGEWKAPDLQEFWYFRFYLIALVLLVSLGKSRVSWTERLCIVFFLNAALTHIRHISIMLMALTPFIARMIDSQFSKNIDNSGIDPDKKQLHLSASSGPIITVVIALSLLGSASIDQGSLSFLTPKQIIDVKAKDLTQLVEYLDEHLPAGKMFNEYALGGYLLFALKEPPKVFIDGRADMYGEQILSDYNAIRFSVPERDKLLEQYGIDWVVFDKDSGLVVALKESESWDTIYTNEHYAVLTKSIQTP